MLSQVSASASTSAATKSALLDREIEECTADLPRSVTKQLFSISKENAVTIVKYIETMKTEVNPSPRYRKNILLSFLYLYLQKNIVKRLTFSNNYILQCVKLWESNLLYVSFILNKW